MDQLTQLMVITMEECGELAQVCSKVLRSRSQLGFISEKNLVKLQQEVADVRCMMDLMYKFELLDHEAKIRVLKLKEKNLKNGAT